MRRNKSTSGQAAKKNPPYRYESQLMFIRPYLLDDGQRFASLNAEESLELLEQGPCRQILSYERENNDPNDDVSDPDDLPRDRQTRATKRPRKEDQADIAINQVLEAMKGQQADDEVDLFFKFMAKSIRTLPKEEIIHFMNETHSRLVETKRILDSSPF